MWQVCGVVKLTYFSNDRNCIPNWFPKVKTMSYICSVFVGTGGSISLTGAAIRIVLASLSGTTHSSKPANHTGICIPIIDRALQMIVMKRDVSHTQA